MTALTSDSIADTETPPRPRHRRTAGSSAPGHSSRHLRAADPGDGERRQRARRRARARTRTASSSAPGPASTSRTTPTTLTRPHRTRAADGPPPARAAPTVGTAGLRAAGAGQPDSAVRRRSTPSCARSCCAPCTTSTHSPRSSGCSGPADGCSSSSTSPPNPAPGCAAGRSASSAHRAGSPGFHTNRHTEVAIRDTDRPGRDPSRPNGSRTACALSPGALPPDRRLSAPAKRDRRARNDRRRGGGRER